jgi:hypothetical protein
VAGWRAERSEIGSFALRIPTGVFLWIAGAISGSLLSVLVAILVTLLASQGNTLVIGFALMLAIPIALIVGAVIGVRQAVRLPQTWYRYESPEEQRIARQRVIAIVSLVVPGLVAILSISIWAVTLPPSDHQLLDNFRKHRATFDLVLQMAEQDRKLLHITDSWTEPNDPESIHVSPGRISKYRDLLKRARVPAGLHVYPEWSEYDFFYWIVGSAISSDREKGYAYRSSAPRHLLADRDWRDTSATPFAEVYRHIDGNWYIYYRYIPN